MLPLLLVRNERRTELRQEARARDPPQARFNVEQRGGDPALLLLAVDPSVDLVGPLADLLIRTTFFMERPPCGVVLRISASLHLTMGSAASSISTNDGIPSLVLFFLKSSPRMSYGRRRLRRFFISTMIRA